MASKSQQQEGQSTQAIEELLDAVDSTLDRLKTLYEQYFLGIQKQAPAFIHSDIERKLRDLTQLNIRNTGLRYRLATLQQKFGSYNSYWRRTLRQIENGTYVRNLAKIGREAVRTGSEIPEEILAAMPKRMREQVVRDRDQAIAVAKRRKQLDEGDASNDELAAIGDAPPLADAVPVKRDVKTASGAHVLSEDDGDIDFNALFSAFEDDAPKPESQQPESISQPITQPASRPQLPRMPVPPTMPSTRPAAPAMGPTTSSTRPAAPAMPLPPTTSSTQPAAPAMPLPPTTSSTQPAPTAVLARVTPVQVPASVARTGPSPVVPRPPAVTPTGGVPRAMGHQASGPTTGVPRPVGQQASGPATGVPRPVGQQPSGPQQASGPVPRPVGAQPSSPTQTGPVPRPVGEQPSSPAQTGPVPRPTPTSMPPRPPTGQNPVVTPPIPRPAPPPPPGRTTQPNPKPAAPQALRPPPGMTEADVNALHAKYVKAKEMVGEKVDPNSREKLLKTINQTAPKVMEQYKASGVDFSIVVKDNQVIIKAKPKT